MKYQQIIEAWNAQSDVQNQWYVLGEDEKVEFALLVGAFESKAEIERLNALLRRALDAISEAVELIGADECTAKETLAAIKTHFEGQQ